MTNAPRRRAIALTAAVAAGVAALVALALPAANSQAATTTLCNSQTLAVSGGAYTVQNNEWGSGAPECISTDGNADFTVANSSISNGTSGAPGGYPSIYKGCHWGACTPASGFPIQVSALHTGTVTSSWRTSQPGGGSAYDVAYDIWFNQAPTTNGQPNGAELMIWLNHNGSVQPFGSQVAGNVSIGGRGYNVWFGNQGWNTISYTMTSPAASVSNLDIGQLAADAVSRGYIQNSWYLIDVEAGFELWQGGAGLATNSFSVSTGGPSPSPSPAPTTASPSPSPSPTQTGTASCSVTYSLANSWPGGFQGQAVIKNTGGAAINGWALAWTFPGDQKITQLWNGSYTQSGAAVRVTNAPYDAAIPAGGTATVGFTGTFTSNDTAPSAFTLNGTPCH
jgi:Glycosyl hydrolase family 12/Cellulose binding domain